MNRPSFCDSICRLAAMLGLLSDVLRRLDGVGVSCSRISLTAIRHLTGSVWSAIQTEPIPPSPICWSSLYRPAMTVPGTSAAMGKDSVSEPALT